MFTDKKRYSELINVGINNLENDEIDKLREIVAHLYQIKVESGADKDMFDAANIIRG